MITSIVTFFNSWQLLLNFLCHSTIFVSILYVAIHNRDLQNWIITPLWYLASISGFVALTIVIQWGIGPEHPLSYWTLGILGELGSHIALASIAVVLLVQTIKSDLLNRSKRYK